MKNVVYCRKIFKTATVPLFIHAIFDTYVYAELKFHMYLQMPTKNALFDCHLQATFQIAERVKNYRTTEARIFFFISELNFHATAFKMAGKKR